MTSRPDRPSASDDGGVLGVLRLAPARALLSTSTLGGLSTGLVPVGLVVHVTTQYGSWAVGGSVLACLTLGRATWPLLQGPAMARWGTARVLVVAGLLHAAALALLALLTFPAVLLVAVAAVGGAAMPALHGVMRVLLPDVAAAHHRSRRAALAVDAAAFEVVYLIGALVATGLLALLGSTRGPAAVLLAAATTTAVGSATFVMAVQRSRTCPVLPMGAEPIAVRAVAPSDRTPRGTRRALAGWVIFGVLFGAIEVVAPVAAGREDAVLAALLIALTSIGSVGGAGWVARRSRDVLPPAAAGVWLLGAGFLLAVAGVGGLESLAAAAVAVGVMFVPFAVTTTGVLLRGSARQAQRRVLWSMTALTVGTAAGSAWAGSVAAAHGWRDTTLVIGAGAVAAGAVLTALGWRSPPRRPTGPDLVHPCTVPTPVTRRIP